MRHEMQPFNTDEGRPFDIQRETRYIPVERDQLGIVDKTKTAIDLAYILEATNEWGTDRFGGANADFLDQLGGEAEPLLSFCEDPVSKAEKYNGGVLIMKGGTEEKAVGWYGKVPGKEHSHIMAFNNGQIFMIQPENPETKVQEAFKTRMSHRATGFSDLSIEGEIVSKEDVEEMLELLNQNSGVAVTYRSDNPNHDAELYPLIHEMVGAVPNPAEDVHATEKITMDPHKRAKLARFKMNRTVAELFDEIDEVRTGTTAKHTARAEVYDAIFDRLNGQEEAGRSVDGENHKEKGEKVV